MTLGRIDQACSIEQKSCLCRMGPAQSLFAPSTDQLTIHFYMPARLLPKIKGLGSRIAILKLKCLRAKKPFLNSFASTLPCQSLGACRGPGSGICCTSQARLASVSQERSDARFRYTQGAKSRSFCLRRPFRANVTFK